MKITFLGTAAAEGIPSPFCTCETCAHARIHRGRNVRRRQSVCINDDLLIDAGPDLFASCGQLGLSLEAVDKLLVTHSHPDHFYAANLLMRSKPFRLATELPELAVAAGPSVWTKWDDSGGSDAASGIRRIAMHPGKQVTLAPYAITSIAAQHHLRIGDAMNYVVQAEDATVLYASDTGYYAEEAWRELERFAIDVVVMEATIWSRAPGAEHLNRSDFFRMLERLRAIGATGDKTIVVATHFSHQGVGPHEELASELARKNVICAYDGFILEI